MEKRLIDLDELIKELDENIENLSKWCEENPQHISYDFVFGKLICLEDLRNQLNQAPF